MYKALPLEIVRIYVFGSDGHRTIAYSNDLSSLSSETDAPTPPSLNPTDNPTLKPSLMPSLNPSVQPSNNPSVIPSSMPTNYPTYSPTNIDEDTLRHWFISEATLDVQSVSNTFMFAEYVESIDDGDSIFIWGGVNNGDGSIYKYNTYIYISTDSAEIYDVLRYLTYAYSKNSFHIDDEIYWLDDEYGLVHYGRYLYSIGANDSTMCD